MAATVGGNLEVHKPGQSGRNEPEDHVDARMPGCQDARHLQRDYDGRGNFPFFQGLRAFRRVEGWYSARNGEEDGGDGGPPSSNQIAALDS
ncbi:hypothetical protein MMC30_000952 [Trapelia coarctata]|nr:hypothetical protein [Trapelia coarctata]